MVGSGEKSSGNLHHDKRIKYDVMAVWTSCGLWRDAYVAFKQREQERSNQERKRLSPKLPRLEDIVKTVPCS